MKIQSYARLHNCQSIQIGGNAVFAFYITLEIFINKTKNIVTMSKNVYKKNKKVLQFK